MRLTFEVGADGYANCGMDIVVWRQRWASDDWDIYGARVRGDNDAVVNSPGEFIIDATGVDQQYPAVATNEQDRYLVVWQHGKGLPTTDWEIYGRELDITSGWASTHIQVAASTDSEQYPAVAAEPPGYLVVYGKIEGTALHIWGRLYWPAAVYLPIILHNQ